MEEGKAAIVPLGDQSLLVRFADSLSDAANRRAVAFAKKLAAARLAGVEEVVPSLVSVQLRLAPGTAFRRLAAEVSLLIDDAPLALTEGVARDIPVIYDGPDLDEVAGLCGLTATTFIARHQSSALRVLAVGFAPGFVYCGFHEEELTVPRRQQVRPSVPAGTVLFAAGQTAICATPIRTGWHVIGHTPLRNFDVERRPPTALAAGESVRFVPA